MQSSIARQFNDTARPLPFGMRYARFLDAPPGAENAGAPAGAAEPDAGETGKGGKAAVLADLATERDKRQALEQTVAQMQQAQKDQMAAIAAAFGVKPDDKDDGTQLLTTLQQQVAAMQHESLVHRIAATHQIADTDDIELLKSAKDEDTMTRLAGRLAAANAEPDQTPKPDLTQGAKGAGAPPEVQPGVARLAQAFEQELTK